MNALRSPTFWALFVLLTIVGLWILRRTNRTHGFKDFLKNPESWQALDEMQNQVERDIQEAQSWSPDQVKKTVWHYVFDVKTGSDAWGERRILQSMEARVQPVLVEILGNPSVREKLVRPTGKDLLVEAPINRLCDLFGDRTPAEAVDLLTPFLSEPSEEVRKDAALAIGKAGTPSIVGPLRKAFSDKDDYVRSYALMGLEYAIKGGHLDDRCKQELFGDVESFVTQGKNADHAAGLLLDFDSPRATEVFLSPAVFTPASESLLNVLRSLAGRSIPVPRERLQALIKELEGMKMEYPYSDALGEALRLLGQQRNPSDAAFLEIRMGHADGDVAKGASAGLLALHGLEEFGPVIARKEESGGFSALSEAQKYVSAVIELDGEVNNGGLSQYFVNSSGDHWREASAGLEAMGFKERMAILREAVAKFGKDGPSTHREARQDQLARLVRKTETLFDSLDDRYYDCKEVIDVFLVRYVIRNAEAFR